MGDLGPVLERIRDRIVPPQDPLQRILDRARRRQRNKQIGTGVLALALFAAAAAGLWAGFRTAPPTIPAAPIEVPLEGAFDVAVGEGAVWVARDTGEDQADFAGEIVRIDPATGRMQARIPLEQVGPVAVGEGSVWVAPYSNGDSAATLIRIDPSTDEVGDVFELPQLDYEVAAGDRAFLPNDVAVGFGRIWVSTARGTVVSLNPRTGEVETQDGKPSTILGGLAVGAGSVWVWNDFVAPEAAVLRVDATSGQIEGRDGAPAVIASVAADQRYVWVSYEPVEQVTPGCVTHTHCQATSALYRDEPATNSRTVFRWPKTEGVLAAADGIGYLGTREGTVWALDDTGSTRLADLGATVSALAVDGSTLWVVTKNGLTRLSPETEDATPSP